MKNDELNTILYGTEKVSKAEPRIIFRGMLDSLQAEVVLAQCRIETMAKMQYVQPELKWIKGRKPYGEGTVRLIAELDEIKAVVDQLIRAEAMNEQASVDKINGLDFDEIREHSNNAYKYYGVETMQLPEREKGLNFALLNSLRTKARETEIGAIVAGQNELAPVLNRLSSALHIMMCKEASGGYR